MHYGDLNPTMHPAWWLDWAGPWWRGGPSGLVSVVDRGGSGQRTGVKRGGLGQSQAGLVLVPLRLAARMTASLAGLVGDMHPQSALDCQTGKSRVVPLARRAARYYWSLRLLENNFPPGAAATRDASSRCSS